MVDTVILKVFVRDLGWDKYKVGQDISPAENVGWATRRALRFALGLELQYKISNICGSLLICVFQVRLRKGSEMMPSQHMASRSQFSKYHSSLKGTTVTLRNSWFQERPRWARKVSQWQKAGTHSKTDVKEPSWRGTRGQTQTTRAPNEWRQ